MPDRLLTIGDRWEDGAYHRVVASPETLDALAARARAVGLTADITRLSTPEDADRFLTEMERNA